MVWVFTDDVIESYVDQAVDQALLNLEAVAVPAGEMTVVLGAGWPVCYCMKRLAMG